MAFRIKYKASLKRQMKLILKKIILSCFYFFFQHILFLANKIELLAYNNACETFGCKEKI